MKRLLSTVLCTTLCFTSLFAQYNSDNLKIPNRDAETFTYENLKLYPIYANETFKEHHAHLGKYTSLETAMAEGKLVVSEVSADDIQAIPDNNSNNIFGDVIEALSFEDNVVQEQTNISNQRNGDNLGEAEVNRLALSNPSNDTIYLMAGQVITGGKQDRVLAQDLIIPPGGKDIDISVYCVERGRWAPNEDSQDGTFQATAGFANVSIRKSAEIDKDQSKVWSAVDESTEEFDAVTSSGTYQAVLKDGELNDRLSTYKDNLVRDFKGQDDIIGFVAVSGSEVIGAEMFATEDLLLENLDGLIQSYATEAIQNGEAPTIAQKDVQTYFNKIVEDESKQEEYVNSNGKVFKAGKTKLHFSTY